MEKIDIQKLCTAILTIAPKVPLTCLSDNSILFRGDRIEIVDGKAIGKRFKFQFYSVDGFLERLRDWGLMMNYSEMSDVLNLYRNGKFYNNDKKR